jgi:hypothetical protein
MMLNEGMDLRRPGQGRGPGGDEVVDAPAVCGPPARCRRRIEDYRDTELTLPVLFPESSSLERGITDLAPPPE